MTSRKGVVHSVDEFVFLEFPFFGSQVGVCFDQVLGDLLVRLFHLINHAMQSTENQTRRITKV